MSDVSIVTVCPICLGTVDVEPTYDDQGATTFDASADVAAHIESEHPDALGAPLVFNSSPGA